MMTTACSKKRGERQSRSHCFIVDIAAAAPLDLSTLGRSISRRMITVTQSRHLKVKAVDGRYIFFFPGTCERLILSYARNEGKIYEHTYNIEQ